jgi:hypothetical protein
VNNKLEQKIKRLLVANKATAADCRRPEGRFQVVANPTTKTEDERGNPIEVATDPLNYVYRDATAKDLCPTCTSASSSQVCQCLDAYLQYDYYKWYCSSGGGFGDVHEPAPRQLPAGCPSFASLGMAGVISNYAGSVDNPLEAVPRTYRMLIEYLTGRYPADTTIPGNWVNVFGPTRLTEPDMQAPTTPAIWQQFWDGTHPYSRSITSSPFFTPGGLQLAKMMFDARCGIRAEATSGACCSVAGDFGGFSCTQVGGPGECQNGTFYSGKTCEQIGGDNCGKSKVSVIAPSKRENTQLGTASITDMIIKALRGGV